MNKSKKKFLELLFLAGVFLAIFLANLIFLIPTLLRLMDNNNHKKPF